MNPIIIDQYHIDITSEEQLTRKEVAEITRAMADTEWLEQYILKQLPRELQKKIEITIGR